MSSAARKPVESAEEYPDLEDDPVWQAIRRAPMGEPETEEERRLVEEALAGPRIPGHVVTAEIAARARREECGE
jgi:hypothetical protein